MHNQHKIGFCSVCGFTHEKVRLYLMAEYNSIVIKPICTSCRKYEREEERLVFCAYCGLVKGKNLYFTTIERLIFEEENTCNFNIPLCEECRKLPHYKIREKLNLEFSNICGSCSDRFKCFTSQHREPCNSALDLNGFHVNPKTKRQWLRFHGRFI